MNYAETLGVKAKAVESAIATAAPQVKNNALAAIADALLSRQEEILAANAKDLEAAVQNHMTASLQDRLRLTPARISGMADAARQLIAAEDPIGSVDSGSVPTVCKSSRPVCRWALSALSLSPVPMLPWMRRPFV